MSSHRYFRPLIFFLFLILCGWIYWPGSDGPSLLDDMSSIGVLKHLDGTPEQAWDYVAGDRSGLFGRRVSMSSFVAERLLGDGSVRTAKQVNILLHLTNGFLVFWLLLLLIGFIETPRYAYGFAVACAAIWLLAPLHVSTVLYQVQRMAMLAATFCFLSLIAYLYWRRTLGAGRSKPTWLLLSALFGLLGVLSKENALVFIPILIVLEIFWLQFKSDCGQDIPWLRRLLTVLAIGGAFVALMLLFLKWEFLVRSHGFREFTLEERVLTQTRVVWDYVCQFFLPATARLGLYHDDFVVSKGLLSPLSTLWASAALILIIAVCLASLRQPSMRIIASGPLIFIVGHSLESTVWPLELYFEHRNYLPSLGLVLFVMAVSRHFCLALPAASKPMLAWVYVYIIFMGALTSSQVTIWSNQHLLALQHIVGHPSSARANRDMALRMAELGAVKGALRYSELAYNSAIEHPAASDEHYGDFVLRNVALACIAGAPLARDEYNQLGIAEPARPLGDVATMKVVVDLYYSERCIDFDWNGFADHLKVLYLGTFDEGQASAKMFAALAVLSNSLERWEDAYSYTSRSLILEPDDVQSLLMQLHFTSILEKQDEVTELKRRLLKLRDEGMLNRGQRETLALYMEV